MRPFIFNRAEDVSGVSGTGVVAEGVVFTDGSVAIKWRVKPGGYSLYNSISEALFVHGHDGRTTLQWLDMKASGQAA